MLSFPIKWPRGNPGTSGTERGARVSSEAWGWRAATADGLKTLIARAGQGPPGRTPARFPGLGELPGGQARAQQGPWSYPAESLGDVQIVPSSKTGHSETLTHPKCLLGFPRSSVSKGSACNAGDLVPISGSGRSPRERKAIHFSLLAWRIPMDRGARQGTVHRVTKVEHDLVTKAIPPSVY